MKSIRGYLAKAALIPVTALATATLAACGGSDTAGTDHGNNTAASVAPGAAFNTADVQFAQMMIPHHQQAVEMADLATTRAADPEGQAARRGHQGRATTRDRHHDRLANLMEAAHSPGRRAQHAGHGHSDARHDVRTGHGWAQSRLGDRLRPAVRPHDDRAPQRCHPDGRDVQKGGSNPEVKRLAVQIEQAQTTEVQQLQKILDRL